MVLEPASHSEEGKVRTPFSDTFARTEKPGGRRRIVFVVIIVVFVLIILTVVGLFAMRYVNDPYRTLPNFSAAKYLDDYKGLAGSHYKARLRVEADLGWKDKGGRLMLFSTEEDPRPFAVILPASVAQGAEFTKGQIYMVELEVKEGGLIYADLFRKD